MDKRIGSNPSLKNFANLQLENQKGKKCAGQLIVVPQNRSETRIAVSGTARYLLGFNISYTPKDVNGNNVEFSKVTQVSIVLNNDIIVNAAPLVLLSPDNNQANEYYKYPRPLTGADNLQIQISNKANETFEIVFTYYFVERA